MVVTAGRQLARSLELQSLNDLGFSKRYVRCLQIAEVVNSMKDLMDFCTEQKAGPIEGLKNFPRDTSTPKVQMQKMQEMEQAGGLPSDRNPLNKLISLNPGLNNSMSNNQQLVGRGPLTGSAQAALALTNYQNLLMRQSSMNSAHSSHQQDASSPFSTSSQTPTTPGPSGVLPGNLQNSPVSGFSSGQASQQRQQLVQHAANGNGNGNGNGLLQQQHQSLQGSQALQQHMIQQLLQDMSNKNNGIPLPQQQSVSMQSLGGGNRNSPAISNGPPGNAAGHPPSRSNSFNNASNPEPAASAGNIGFNEKASDLSQNLHLSDELVSDVAHEFSENGFFNNDLDDNMSFDWKA